MFNVNASSSLALEEVKEVGSRVVKVVDFLLYSMQQVRGLNKFYYFNLNRTLYMVDALSGNIYSYSKGVDCVVVRVVGFDIVVDTGTSEDVIGSAVNGSIVEFNRDAVRSIGSSRNSSEDNEGRIIYESITLVLDGLSCTISTHQVIALIKYGDMIYTTLGRYGNVIDHRDGNKLNNSIYNIEIVTRSENVQRYYDNK